jgi:cyclase
MLLLTCAAAAAVSADYVRPTPQRIEVAKGVYLFISKPYGDVGLDGNAVAILSNDGVLVFDSNGTPASSAAVLAGIRQLTDKPVKYVVNSHWHWDHWYGTETYTHAFPDVKVVAHEKTREMMAGPAIEFNRKGVESDLPGYVAALEKAVATKPQLQPLLEEDRFFLEQKQNAHLVLPGTTFTDRLSIRLGERRIEVLHYDRAVTPGDTFLYLPAEKIVITGDLLVNPVSFALSSYPTGWLQTLEKIDALDATVLVPGHGEPLRDKERCEGARVGSGSGAGGNLPAPAQPDGQDHPGRSQGERRVQDLPRRLVPAPRLRRAERTTQRRNFCDPAALTTSQKQLCPHLPPQSADPGSDPKSALADELGVRPRSTRRRSNRPGCSWVGAPPPRR